MWCPHPSNETSTEYIVEGLENVQIRFQAFIDFKKDDGPPSVHYRTPHPRIGCFNKSCVHTYPAEKDSNMVYLKTLFDMAGVSKTTFVNESGILKVTFLWECNIYQDECEPQVTSEKFLFSTINGSYVMKQSFPYEIGSTPYRELHEKTGIRLIFFSEGVGREISLVSVIT